jgi:hypothetical protein
VVRVRHDGDPATAKEVEITYVQQGRLYTVKAAHCILACWHPVIPYLTDELPAPQMAAHCDRRRRFPCLHQRGAQELAELRPPADAASLRPDATSPSSVLTIA